MKTISLVIALLAARALPAAAAPSCGELIDSACDARAVSTLVAAGADINCYSNAGRTPLGTAVDSAEYEERVKKTTTCSEGALRLLQLGANPNALTHANTGTPLTLAVQNGNVVVAKALLAHPRIDVNLKPPSGYAPIHSLFVGCGRDESDEVLELLIQAQANLSVLDADGTNAAVSAASCGRVKMAKRLRSMGLTLRAVKGKFSPFCSAGHWTEEEVLERRETLDLLVIDGTDVNDVIARPLLGRMLGWDEYTPLRCAVSASNEELVNFLLDKGAKVDVESMAIAKRLAARDLRGAWNAERSLEKGDDILALLSSKRKRP